MTMATVSTHRSSSLHDSHALALARSARDQLARALAELQRPDVPPACLDTAGTVAKAMGFLHRYESEARPSAARNALSAVRCALGDLQGIRGGHPAIDSAMRHVAGSLGLLHSVGELVNVGRDHASIPAAKAPSASQTLLLHGGQSPDTTDTAKAVPSPQRPVNAPANNPVNDNEKSWAKRRLGPWKQPESGPNGAPRTSVVHAALGTHSHTNFYRGLSDDIFDSGGLFIATYDVPPQGATLRVNVSMPGGYEFKAEGVVEWTRAAPDDAASIPDVSPGFGLRFTRMTKEGKSLVRRYVRNREPLFHD